MIKKFNQNGILCKKCSIIENKLKNENLFNNINKHIYVRNNEDIYYINKYNISTYPYFIVTNNKKEKCYTSYLKFKKDIFNKNINNNEIIENIVIDIF